jgi:hypothetical protein
LPGPQVENYSLIIPIREDLDQAEADQITALSLLAVVWLPMAAKDSR